MAEKKIVLVVGCNGLLGQKTVQRFANNFRVIGCDLSSEPAGTSIPEEGYFSVNIGDRAAVQSKIGAINADIIINAAAYTNVDGAEKQKDLCWNVNVKGVEHLLEVAHHGSPLFVHISSDYVFDGDAAPYREEDELSPLGFYGRSKETSEKIIRASGVEYIIARSQILYGAGEKVRPNFVTWLINELKNERPVNIVNDQIGNPTLIDDLAEAVFKLIAHEEYGLYHVSGSESLSRLDFAHKIAEVFELQDGLINETTSELLGQAAKRPMDSTFILDKLYNAIDWLPGDVNSSLRKLTQQL